MTYTAVCVGGPKDGQVVTNQYPAFEVIIKEDIPFNIVEPLGPYATYDKVTYRIMRLYRHPDADHVIVFAPEGATIYEIMSRLIHGYKQP